MSRSGLQVGCERGGMANTTLVEWLWTTASSELSARVGDKRDDVRRRVPRAGGGDLWTSGHGGVPGGGRQSPGRLVPELAQLRTYECDGLTNPVELLDASVRGGPDRRDQGSRDRPRDDARTAEPGTSRSRRRPHVSC